jgi:hypothetical protein
VYHPSLLAQGTADVKRPIIAQVEAGLDEVLEMAGSGAAQRDIEERIWDVLLPAAQLTMSSALSVQCRAATDADIAARGLGEDQVRLRNEDDYWMTLTTTLGPVSFFSFAYRDSSSGVTTVTRTPAREEVFPLHRHCRSSELCLEWESRLGSEMPFRHAQQALCYFTHGAVAMEDTTIASHLLTVSRLVGREWLYQSPEKIREVLVERATRDLETGKPIIYLSTDAHALRRYVDETWDAQWKMANGLRLWCVDRNSGAIIHLGGEFTWGDCHVVAEIVDWLIDTGHVPADGDYDGGVVASVTVLTDGMPWIEDHVVSKFTEPVAILDAYHVMEHLQQYADARFGKGSKQARALYASSVRLLLGKRSAKGKKPRKTAGDSDDVDAADNETDAEDSGADEQQPDATGLPPWLAWGASDRSPTAVEVLLEMLALEDVSIYAEDDRDKLVGYLEHNAYRMDYRRCRALGYQIGSGAMESLHRTGSQARLKIPGARWLPETSQALFNTRMLYLCGRWDEFWHQPGLHAMLVEVFSSRTEPAADQGDLPKDVVEEGYDAAA